ncbi:MAG: autotransporter outer membrane beta-barrel domain-containing protein [Oligoflexia bacterium]|nr:autotransporter outer membrane beta-barrel domain-containing protein [Oligoflexia bacterium]
MKKLVFVSFIAFFLSQPLLAKTNKPEEPKKSPAKTSIEEIKENQKKTKDNDSNFRAWEFRTAPLTLLIRWLTLEAAYRPNAHIAVGPTLIKYFGSTTPFIIGFRGYAIGVFGTYYVNPLPEAGFYGTARYYYEKYTVYSSPDSSSRDIISMKGHTMTLIGGYRFPIGASFFGLIGAGAQFRFVDLVETSYSRTTIKNNTLRFVPYLEAKVGIEI